MKLKGKVALVTGAAQGIGRAIATAMAQEGADIAVVDVDLDQACITMHEVEQLGRRVIVLQADVSDSASVTRAFQECTDKLGKVSVLVNNAGIGAPTLGLEVSEEGWDRVVSVNLKGMFLCCKVAVPQLVEQGWGRIVNIASQAAFTGSSIGDLPYAASKSGVVGFTKTLARILADKGVNVNAIAPGLIDTELPTRSGRRTPEEWLTQVARTVPMKRLGSPGEVARVAVFLASDDSSYVTGETISVSGGSLLR